MLLLFVCYIMGNIQISKAQSLPLSNPVLKLLSFIYNSSMLKEPKIDSLALMNWEAMLLIKPEKYRFLMAVI